MKIFKMPIMATEKSEAMMLTDSNLATRASRANNSDEKANDYNYWFVNKDGVGGGTL